MKTHNTHIGNIIPNLKINGKPAPYPVLNERAIRATAGILFAIGISTMWYSVLTHDRTLIYRVLPIFRSHFLIVTTRWPRYAPLGALGRLLVSRQKPDYVWAIQKRFAWSMGLSMATLMGILVIMGASSPWLLSVCGTCLTLMRLETSAGICVGCLIYGALVRKWYITKPEHKPACPGWSCSID